MRNLKFKYAKAENFLCFGEEGIEINFESYGNIVVIKGKNLDVVDQDGEKASNGSGKSSIPEIIVYALYGKTIKKPKKLTHLNLINNSAEKKLVVDFRWDDYRIVRKRDANNIGTVQLWQSPEGIWNKDTEITVPGKAMQKKIEGIIGLTYESFINIFVFSDDNTNPFLECENPAKREIVENILSLEKYRAYSDNAKNLTKALKNKIKDLTKEYEFLAEQKEGCVKNIAQIEKQEREWYEKIKKELNSLLNEIKTKRDELESSDKGAELAVYTEAQEEIEELKQKIPELEKEKENLSETLKVGTIKYDNLLVNISNLKTQVIDLKKEISKFENLISDNKETISGIKNKTKNPCPYCLGKVEEKNFSNMIEQAEKVIVENEVLLVGKKEEYNKDFSFLDVSEKKKVNADLTVARYKQNIRDKETSISEMHCRIAELNKVSKPDSTVRELLISEQIVSLKKQANDKQEQLNSITPYDVIKQTAIAELATKTQDCKKKKDELKESEDLVPYYDFWLKAFGDTGIRKYVIDGIIPTLNDRIEYWLQFLIDNKIKLTFNNELDETIDRYPFNGRPYVYHGMSGGQRRRLNLTVSAAWAFVSALNSGAAPSVIFLDEVTMNVDLVGVLGIYRMICELAKEKQVFVIDHNESLLEMLNGCDTIQLEMKDEVSKKV